MATSTLYTFAEHQGAMVLVQAEPASSGPVPDVVKWKSQPEHRLYVVYITAEDQGEPPFSIHITVAPAIIRGWAIYQMEKVRLTEGGMLNDKQACFHVQQLAPRERIRLDILARGPPGPVQVVVADPGTG